MKTNRLEAFSDGVLAIIITIMVLEMKPPAHAAHLANLRPVLPAFLSYILSFIYVGIYWNNHHHMIHVTRRVNGAIMWANLHLLFWLSLIPFVTAWMGENEFARPPVALYGGVLLMAAVAYSILEWAILRDMGADSILARAIGRDWKGKLPILFYGSAIAAALYVPSVAGVLIASLLYVIVALMWLVPDRRIERALAQSGRARRHPSAPPIKP